MKNIQFIEGVNIIAKYLPKEKNTDFDLYAAHEQIWFCDFDLIPDGKDKKRLKELGWFEDEDSWSCYT
jgi:hypothetical protein